MEPVFTCGSPRISPPTLEAVRAAAAQLSPTQPAVPEITESVNKLLATHLETVEARLANRLGGSAGDVSLTFVFINTSRLPLTSQDGGRPPDHLPVIGYRRVGTAGYCSPPGRSGTGGCPVGGSIPTGV